MKKQNVVWMSCFGFMVLAACRQGEVLTESEENLSLQVRASITADGSFARSTTNEQGISSFVADDEIGLFLPEDENQVKWTLQGDDWTAEHDVEWKDKVNAYTFCAYYPYSEATASRTEIPMPDLSQQRGTLDGVGGMDFLAARYTGSYQSHTGVVSFTGASAFKHIYALVSVTVRKSAANEEVALSKEKFDGADCFKKHTYQFGAADENDRMNPVGDVSSGALEFTHAPAAAVGGEGHTTFVLVNPSEAKTRLDYSIAYERDGISYTASTDKLANTFRSGYFYRYTLKLTKEGLSIDGCDIQEWKTETLVDIPIKEDPAELSTLQ